METILDEFFNHNQLVNKSNQYKNQSYPVHEMAKELTENEVSLKNADLMQ